MPFLAKSLTALGVLLLSHACYSAHEHSSLLAHSPSSSSPSLLPSSSLLRSAGTTATTLPLDITLETLVSVLLICVGFVSSAEALKPISWRVWAGKIERERGEGVGGVGTGTGVGLNPYEGLEARVGFWDIRASRREFAEWVRERGTGAKG